MKIPYSLIKSRTDNDQFSLFPFNAIVLFCFFQILKQLALEIIIYSSERCYNDITVCEPIAFHCTLKMQSTKNKNCLHLLKHMHLNYKRGKIDICSWHCFMSQFLKTIENVKSLRITSMSSFALKSLIYK